MMNSCSIHLLLFLNLFCRMSFSALFLLLITFCRLSSTEDYIVNVKTSREPVTRVEGQSLTLKCTVEYNEMQCGGLKALWHLERKQYLTNPDTYLIHVNETQIPEKTGFRRRDVFIQFQQLSFNDTGTYQCIGECVLGPKAMGRFLSLIVAEKIKKNLRN